MSAMPRVTVLMPVHNQAAHLRTSLRCVLAQRFGDLEVIVCGDGCTDESERVVVEADDARVRWAGFPKAPGYGYDNRDRALALARGTLVAYLAPDDLWTPDHLSVLVAALEDERADFVFARPVNADARRRLRRHYLPFDLLASGEQPPVGPRLYALSPSQVLHRRALLARAGGWTTPVLRHGDVDLWLRFRAAGARMRYVPRATVVRLPGRDFRGVETERAAALHAQLARALIDGTIDLSGARSSLPRRALGWAEDLFAVGRTQGPSMLRMLATRRGRTVRRRARSGSPDLGMEREA